MYAIISSPKNVVEKTGKEESEQAQSSVAQSTEGMKEGRHGCFKVNDKRMCSVQCTPEVKRETERKREREGEEEKKRRNVRLGMEDKREMK